MINLTFSWDFMNIKDARGKTIEIGFYIRYTGTGTIGKVVDLKTDEEDIGWAKMEEPNLWYSENVIEIVDEDNIKDKDFKDKKFNVDELKERNRDFEESSLTSGGAEGGG